MKRAISLLVAIVMVISMIPNVFAADDDAIVLDSIAEIEVVLNAENGYYAMYSWTPSEDGELNIYQYTDKEIEVIITQGDNSATNYFEDEDGVYYGFFTCLGLVADEEVIIEFANSVEEDEAFYAWGDFFGEPGKSIDNPVYLEDVANTVYNEGTIYYAGFYGGAEIVITGEGAFTVTVNEEVLTSENGVVTFAGVGKTVIFSIEGEGEFSIVANYPMGTQMNPEILFRPAAIWVNIAEGNDQGYYYKWTAMEAGQLVLTCPTIEGVEYDVTLYNLNTWAMSSLSESEDGTVAVNVGYGDEVQIHIAALPDDQMAYPAVSTTLTGALLQNLGTRENPEIIFSAEEIVLDIPEGRSQGYYYKWTTFADGTLTLVCPEVEGVEYDVILTNMSTYAQAWMSDSNNGTVSMDVKSGDAVIIEIGIYPDANWNTPALATTLTGSFTYPIGSYDNPEIIFRPNYISVNIAEGAAEYNYKWTANADGELVLTCPTVEGVGYNVILTNQSTYDMAWLSDSTDGTVAMEVSAGDEVTVVVVVDPDEYWNYPALVTALTGEFIFPVGTQMNPEIIFRPAYINVNIAEGNNQGYYYKWTANADGELKLTCPTVEGVDYDVNMINLSTYNQVWLQDSNDGTISLAVSAGDEIIIQVCAIPDASWNIPALQTALTGEFIFPVGTQMNPEILFRPAYINVNIAEGNNQGYFYKWTANTNGTLVLTCPEVEGVVYDVNMINLSTYEQAWLQDSTDGTIALDIKSGDEVIIQVCAIPDASWNIPALNTGLYGQIILPIGSDMNPEIIEELSWFYGNVAQEQGDFDGYFYQWTAAEDGVATFYFGWNELEGYELDIMVTNMNTYAQYSLLSDGVDNYGLELQVPVKAGQQLMINVAAVKDADGNYYPAAEMTWCGNFAAPAGSEKNPIYIEFNWNDAYSAADATVTVEAGATVYFSANAGMILTVNGEVVEMNADGVFAITNNTDAAVEYAVALDTPVGAYNNPEVIETLPFEDANSLAEGESYNYIWTATEDATVVLSVTDGANIVADLLTYVEDSEWPISEQFELATPAIDENWNYTGWDVAENLTIQVKAGQQLKIQINGLTDWATWKTPAIDYTLTITAEVEEKGIVAQPENVTANSGESVQFSVETVGEVVSYKWEYRKIYKWFDTNMEGYNTDTLTVPVNGARNGYAYRCIVTYADGTEIISEIAQLTVNSTIVITSHPNNQLVTLGCKGQFTAAAEGDGIAYAWQYSRNGETWAYTQMEGYTKPTVMIETTAARDGYLYRCEIKDATGAVEYTSVATLNVLTFTKQPENMRTSAGSKVTFSVETNQEPVSYQWQYSKNGETWTNTTMSGYNTAALTVDATSARNGYQYRCVITGAKNSKLESKAAVLNIGAAAEITAQPESVTAAAGATVTFAVEAANVYTYQWQYSKNGTDWYTTTMPGATTNTLSVAVTAGRNGYQYRCQILGTDGEVVYTNVATLTVG
ncbi:MAG: hypothetical protein IKU07_04405 [Oscillospiraceae bacterium]|nr:hypothetical protein [Oscillospiraceae bacterium]